jgi:archaellum component FlaC
MVDTSKIPAERVDIDWSKVDESIEKYNEITSKVDDISSQYNEMNDKYNELLSQLENLPKHVVVDELPENIDENTFYYIKEDEVVGE